MSETTSMALNDDGYQAKSVDASRVGKAVEHLVAASCILASGARLNVSTSLVDDEGVDIVFHRRDGTSTIAAQVKSRSTNTTGLAKGAFAAFVRSQTFKPRLELYLLFVVVDQGAASIGTEASTTACRAGLLMNKVSASSMARSRTPMCTQITCVEVTPLATPIRRASASEFP